MDRALQHAGAHGAECQHADDQGQDEDHDLGRIEPELDLYAAQAGDHDDRRHRQADGGERGTEADIDRALQMVGGGGMEGGQPFGRQHQDGDDHAAERCGQAERVGAVVDDDGELLRQKHDRHECRDEEDRVIAEGPGLERIVTAMAGRLRRRVDDARRFGEVLAVPHGLHGEEGRVEKHSHQGEDQPLGERQRRVGGRGREPRQNQGQRRQRDEDAQIGARALQVEALLAVLEPADEERKPDHAVEHDDEDGEHRVARQRRVRSAMQHDGGDDRNLDADHRNSQHQRAERLAEEFGQAVGMTHDGKGTPHHDCEQPDEEHHGEGRIVQPVEPALAGRIEESRRQHAHDECSFRAHDPDHDDIPSTDPPPVTGSRSTPRPAAGMGRRHASRFARCRHRLCRPGWKRETSGSYRRLNVPADMTAPHEGHAARVAATKLRPRPKVASSSGLPREPIPFPSLLHDVAENGARQALRCRTTSRRCGRSRCSNR